MKRLFLSLTLAASLFSYGCSSKKDSNEVAKDINETKIEDKAVTNTEGTSPGDQKDESEYLVDLANTGLTEYELSKVAAERAGNPQVKAFAETTVKQHAVDETELRKMTKTKNLTLPTTLSKDSQAMLAALIDQKVGKNFDKKYLNQMQDISDKAISKAKGVVNNTEDIALKNFINKIRAADEQHKSKAEELEDVL